MLKAADEGKSSPAATAVCVPNHSMESERQEFGRKEGGDSDWSQHVVEVLGSGRERGNRPVAEMYLKGRVVSAVHANRLRK